jgi:hypothetical protein
MRSTACNWLSGKVAEAAVWNVALTITDVAVLNAGYSPLFVKPQNLVAYWPLARDYFNQWHCKFSCSNLLAFRAGTPEASAHCPIINPSPNHLRSSTIFRNMASTIVASSGASGSLRFGALALGLDEPVKREFVYPVIPNDASPELTAFLLELRLLIEQLNIGDVRVGGHAITDGQIISSTQVSNGFLERHS